MADRYTTATFDVTIEGADLTGCDMVLTFRQGRRTLNLRFSRDGGLAVDPEAGTATASVSLSQLRTARFEADRPIEVQANFMDASGFRGDTEIETMTIGRNLYERVMRDA